MCGANQVGLDDLTNPDGSSPRVRGELPRQSGRLGTCRIIPACAGRTTHVPRNYVLKADHPRVCGANQAESIESALSAGSSPRVRGELKRTVFTRPPHRIIPACAGRTRTRTASTTAAGTDHPRVCGANGDGAGLEAGLVGSSPRVRGERTVSDGSDQTVRIIPACAGRTPYPLLPPHPSTDHPRVCGANDVDRVMREIGNGSSPRVRGERRRISVGFRGRRIIPACAGRTAATSRRGWREPDHPRVCGANVGFITGTLVPAGSSPRVRGERDGDLHDRRPGRIIPACAGRT